MTFDLLLAAKILVAPTSEEIKANPEAWERLLVEAVRFVRAGGRVDLAGWAGLHDAEREALIVAREVVATERALATGLAAQGPFQAADVAARVDGGEARRRLLLEVAAGRVLASLQGAGPVAP